MLRQLVRRRSADEDRLQHRTPQCSLPLHRQFGAINHGRVVLNRLGRGKFKGYSAGSQPAGAVNPVALRVLEQAHYDTSGLHSKSWDEFASPDAPKLDFVFPVCDNAAQEVCPIWPGQPMTAHWGLPDPVRAEGSEAERHLAFADALRMLTNRIGIFVSLPFDKLSK